MEKKTAPIVEIPECYRFRPTDTELIELFLMRKSRKQPLPKVPQILERPLYGEQAPWDVFMEDDHWEYIEVPRKRIIFVFSKLIHKNGQSKNRVVRTTGCGTWKGEAAKKIKDSQGKVIGIMRTLTFKPKKGFESEMKGKWIVHEYSLAKSDENFEDDGYVICRINFHDPKQTSDEEGEEYESGLDSGRIRVDLWKKGKTLTSNGGMKKKQKQKSEKLGNGGIRDIRIASDYQAVRFRKSNGTVAQSPEFLSMLEFQNRENFPYLAVMGLRAGQPQLLSQRGDVIPYATAVAAGQRKEVTPYSNASGSEDDDDDDASDN